MKSLDELVLMTETRIREESYTGIPPALYEPIKYIMSLGGKRLRPVLLLLGAQLYGKKPERVLDAAVGIEVFHNFTLMHDDIMDNAPIRRGKPTVHTKWDSNTAILSGDTMMVLAYDYFMKSSDDHLIEVLLTFNQTAREVCEGQQYDMEFETRLDVSIPEYMEMIRLKTSVLIAAALKIGAQLAGAPEGDVENLYRFGEKIGLAFQLKDDLLDVFGEVVKFGKQTGNDILTNKKTFLLVSCLESASSEDKKQIYRWLQENSNPEEKIRVIKTLYDKYSIKELTNKKIESLFAEGSEFLNKLKLTQHQAEPFYQLLDSLKVRES